MDQIIIDMLSFLMENSGKISAFLGLAGTVSYLTLKVTRKVSAKVKPYLQVVNGVKELGDKIDNIAKQFEYDHGFSLKDQVGKIESTLDRNTKITELIFNRQRWLMDNRNEPVFEADQDGNFTWVNVSFAKLVRRGVLELVNNKWRNIISEENRAETIEAWSAAVNQKRNFEQTIHITDKSGNQYSAMCIAALQADGNYVGTLSDVEKVEKHVDKVHVSA